MRVFAQNNHCPSQVLFAFDDATDARRSSSALGSGVRHASRFVIA